MRPPHGPIIPGGMSAATAPAATTTLPTALSHSDVLGVLVLSHGAAERPEDLEAYYSHILHGRTPRPDRLRALEERYAAIGGVSPLNGITRRQGDQIADALQARGRRARAYVGFQHTRPFISDAVARLVADGVRRAVAIVMTPYYSPRGVGHYHAEVGKALERCDGGAAVDVRPVDCWHDEAAFLDLLTGRVADALRVVNGQGAGPTHVVFTAHSLPVLPSDRNSDAPYAAQFAGTARAVAERLEVDRWSTCYQSASDNGMTWLGPDIMEEIERVHGTGAGRLVVCASSFAADNLEVLYDVGIDAARRARELGMAFVQTCPLNDDPALADLLATVVARCAPVADAAPPRPPRWPSDRPSRGSLMDSDRRPRVVVIGGGITGLAAAYALSSARRDHGSPVDVTLLEASERLGGKVQTERAGGFVIEQGPDAMLSRKVEGRRFCQELGLGGELVGSNSGAGGTYVVHRGHLEPLPDGMLLVAPIHLRAWLRTRLLSWTGKLRAGLDLVLPARRDGADETLAEFVGRRFGRQVADRLAVPLLAAVYGGGSGDLSLKATFPDLGELERAHRSLLIGLRAMARRRAAAAGTAKTEARGTSAEARKDAAPAPPSFFTTLRSGMASMVGAAAEALSGAGVEVRLGAPVTRLEPLGGGQGFRVEIAGGDAIEAAGVVLAAPAGAAARLVESFAPDAVGPLRRITYLPMTVVVLAFPKARIAHPLNGTGFLVPESEGRRLIACTWLSRKWPHVSDLDTMLLRCYVGGARGEALLTRSDEALVALACDELRDLLGVGGEPTFSRVYRWERGIPRYERGHLERVAEAERALAAFPRLALAGAAYRGVGIPDCIRQGEQAAASVLAACVPQAAQHCEQPSRGVPAAAVARAPAVVSAAH